MPGRKQLGQILLEAGVIDEFQLKSALGYQKQWGGRLGKVLVENRFITEEALIEAIHRQTGIEVAEIGDTMLPDYLTKLVPVELATRHNLVPIRQEGEPGKPNEVLIVAMSDPTNLNALDEVQFRTGKKTRAMLASESAISKVIRTSYLGEQVSEETEFEQAPDDIQFSGQDIAVDDLVLVKGKLEQAEKQVAAQETAASKTNGLDLEDPFAQLDSLAREPEGNPQPAVAPIPPVAQPVSDTAAAATSVERLAAAEPPQEESEQPQSQQPASDSGLPEAEVLEKGLPELELVEEISPEPPAPAAAADSSSFGQSGELLMSPIREVDAPAAPKEQVAQVEQKKAPKKTERSTGRPGSSAMEALLSRVGIGVDGGKPGSEEPRPAPAPETAGQAVAADDQMIPDLEMPSSLPDEIAQMLEKIEAEQPDEEQPQVMKSGQLIAAVIRLLLKKEIFSDSEFLEELKKH